MSKTASDILNEWILRGYIAAEESPEKHLPYINQAKDAICAYCNLPMGIQKLPDVLFYPWVEISYNIMQGGTFSQITDAVSGVVKSVQEGDTTINFVGSTSSDSTVVPKPIIDYSAELNRYRQLF